MRVDDLTPGELYRLQAIIEQIHDDYLAWATPFERHQLPEKAAMEGTPRGEPRARYLTFSLLLSYDTGTRRLWETAHRLWDDYPWLFHPRMLVVKRTRTDVTTIFEQNGIRYWRRDAAAWSQLASILVESYRGSVLSLVASVECDAVRLLRRVRTEGSPVLSGQKSGPQWCRLLHEDVVRLYRINRIPFPVDVSVYRVSKELVGPFNSTEIVRAFWREFCSLSGFDPVLVYRSLWLVGTHWDKWGRTYLDSVRSAVNS
jgi:endonuclease III